MSSLQKSFAQIPTRSRLLFAINSDSGFTQLKLANTLTAHPTAVHLYDGTILNTTNAHTFLGNINDGRNFTTGDVLRDLGKSLYIQTNGRTDYIFTYVQQVQGPLTEGVPDNYNVSSTTEGNFYVCTWAANIAGNYVNVIRSG
jgi:hypothetical protein